MSEVNVQIQNPQQTVNINNPSIVIEIPTDSIEVEITNQALEIQVQSPVIEVNIGGPCDCSGGGHTIEDEGTPLTQRDTLNFTGAGVTVTDAGGKTVVTIPGGAGASDWGDIGGTLSDQTDLQAALDGKVDENAAITGATKTKITYDAKGLVTAGDDAAIADITGLQTALDGKAASSHTHPLSDLTQSGATLNQIPKWNGSAWVPADDETGGGGSVEITDITYADMETALGGSTLTPGQFYRITDAVGTDLGFICQAIRENEITVNGTGGYLNADFQAVGDYGNTPETFNEQNGIWAADNEGGYSQGDVAIWNLLHYQLTDGDAIDGTDPETNTAAYTLLDKATYPETYVEAWDISEFDFANNWIQYRQDLRGNVFKYSKASDDIGAGFGEPAILYFQWGRDEWQSNSIEDGYIDQKNFRGSIVSCKLIGAEAAIYGNTSNENGFISNVFMDNGGIFDNQINGAGINAMYIYGGNIYENTFSTEIQLSTCFVYYGADITGLDLSAGGAVFGLYMAAASKVENITLSFACQFRYQTLGVSSIISNLSLGDSTVSENNILENGASLTGITAGANCSISRNKLGQGATLGGSTTMGDGANFNDLDIRANKTVGNLVLDASVGFSDKVIQVSIDAGETVLDTVNGSRAIPGFSDIPATIDITGLTAIDFTAAWAQYRGVYNLTSSNATETIAADSLSNFPTLFPFRLVPASGLTLTLTGTAAASATNGSIVMSGATIVLDGTNGDFVELEADSTETFVRVKNVQIYA